jgi:hypothetical protein
VALEQALSNMVSMAYAAAEEMRHVVQPAVHPGPNAQMQPHAAHFSEYTLATSSLDRYLE